MPTTTHSRNDEIGALFSRHASGLRTTVARTTTATADELDEACGFAWTQLLSHPDVDLNERSTFWWLYRTAQRKAWSLHARGKHELPSGLAHAGGDDDYLARHADCSADVLQQIEDREDLRALHTLRPAVRETIVLRACGYSYAELCARLGVSGSTITRRLDRGRELAAKLARERG